MIDLLIQAIVFVVTTAGTVGLALWFLRKQTQVSARLLFITAISVEIACLVLLQNLVYLDVPLAQSAWGVAALSLVGVVLLINLRRGLRMSAPERATALAGSGVGILVFVIQSVPLALIEPKNYYGTGKYDHVSYVQTTQFLADIPFHTDVSRLSGQPWVIQGATKKNDRIGQCIANGYLAVVSFTDAQSAYGAINVACIALASVAAFFLLRAFSVSRLLSVVAALWLGLLPSVTRMHTDGFFSQTATLFVLPALALAAMARKDTFNVSLASSALLLAYTSAAYTEILPIAFAAIAAMVLLNRNLPFARRTLFLALALVGALVLIPNYAIEILRFCAGQYHDIDAYPELHTLTPRAGTWSGWSELFVLIPGGRLYPASLACGFFLLALALGAFASTSLVRRLQLLAVAAAPGLCLAVIMSLNEFRPYPFGKLLVTFTPLWVVLITLGLARFRRLFSWLSAPNFRYLGLPVSPITLKVALTIACFFTGCGTAVATARAFHRMLRNRDSIHSSAFVVVSTELRRSPNQTFLLTEVDTVARNWIIYHSRNSRLYLDRREADSAALPTTANNQGKIKDFTGGYREVNVYSISPH